MPPRTTELARTELQRAPVRQRPAPVICPTCRLFLPFDVEDVDPDLVCRCGSDWAPEIPSPRRVASTLKRSSGLAPVSKARAAENRERRKVLAEIAEEHPGCAASLPMCTGWAQDGHEVLTRARGGSITDRANIIGVCRPCHDEITEPSDPGLMYELGLLRHSWDRGDVA